MKRENRINRWRNEQTVMEDYNRVRNRTSTSVRSDLLWREGPHIWCWAFQQPREEANMIHGVHQWNEAGCLEKPHPAWYWKQRVMSPIISLSRKTPSKVMDNILFRNTVITFISPFLCCPSRWTRVSAVTKLTENQLWKERVFLHGRLSLSDGLPSAPGWNVDYLFLTWLLCAPWTWIF